MQRHRGLLIVTVALGLAATVLIVAQATLLAYVIAEAFIGGRSLAALTAVRAALTALVVVIPTMAMGATLPVLSRITAGAGRLPALYAISDLFVMPSTDHETFCVAACEAMGCARPVVAARTGGLESGC